MFCPGCGKQGAGLCWECYLKAHPLKFGKVKLTCCSCGRFKHREDWEQDVNSFIKSTIFKKLVIPEQIKDVSLEARLSEEEKGFQVIGTLRGMYQNQKIRLDFTLPATIQKESCTHCTRQSAGYFEAVIQYRGGGTPTFHIAHKQLCKIDEVRGGINYYLMSAQYAAQVAQKALQEGYLIKKTAKLVGKRNGKDMYRIYYSVKSPRVQKGDVVIHKQNPWMVKTLGAKSVMVNLTSGKETMLPMNRLKDLPIALEKKQVKKATVTTVTPLKTTALPHASQKSVKVEKTNAALTPGQQINLAPLKRKYYLYPIY